MSGGPYALIGDGRLATSLAPWLRAHSADVLTWSRRAEASGSCPPLAQVVADTPVVLLAISDSAIEPFALAHAAPLAGRHLVHFSGALVVPEMTGLHPLFAFPTTPVPTTAMDEIVFVADQGAGRLQDIFPMLPNRCEAIAASDRPLYHALAVLSGNLTTLAWNEVAVQLEDRLQLDAKALMRPYLKSLIDGFAASPRDSLTGPVRRGDQVTIARNRAALEPERALVVLYDAMVSAAGLAGRAGPTPQEPCA